MTMKQISTAITFLAALLLAACSQDDMTVSDNVATVRIVASIDRGMTTRAVTDDTDDLPARAVLWYKKSSDDANSADSWTKMESSDLTEGTFTFNVEFDKTEEYDIVCWADDGDNEQQNSDLMSPIDITQMRSSIAFSEWDHNFQPQYEWVSWGLSHVVAKLVVNETGTLEVGDCVKLDFTQSCYGYDALNGTYSRKTDNDKSVHLEKTISGTGDESGNMFTYYYLAPPVGDDGAIVQDIKLTYVHNGRECEKTITNVPIHANRRTVISGSFKSLDNYADVAFNITTDDNWEGEWASEATVSGSTITMYSPGQLTMEVLDKAAGTDGNAITICGSDMNNEDFSVLREWLMILAQPYDIELTDATQLNLSSLAINTLKMPNLTTLTTASARYLVIYDSAWFTKAGNLDIEQSSLASCFFEENAVIYLNADKRPGGGATPTVTQNQDDDTYYEWGETGFGASKDKFRFVDAEGNITDIDGNVVVTE